MTILQHLISGLKLLAIQERDPDGIRRDPTGVASPSRSPVQGFSQNTWDPLRDPTGPAYDASADEGRISVKIKYEEETFPCL